MFFKRISLPLMLQIIQWKLPQDCFLGMECLTEAKGWTKNVFKVWGRKWQNHPSFIFGMTTSIKPGPCIQSMNLELYMTQPIPNKLG